MKQFVSVPVMKDHLHEKTCFPYLSMILLLVQAPVLWFWPVIELLQLYNSLLQFVSRGMKEGINDQFVW